MAFEECSCGVRRYFTRFIRTSPIFAFGTQVQYIDNYDVAPSNNLQKIFQAVTCSQNKLNTIK